MSAPLHDITTDGTTVWVNAAWLLGRFGRFGIDVHRNIEDQQTKGECLHCTHTLPPVETGPKEWAEFVTKMKEHHDIEVPEKYRPARCKPVGLFAQAVGRAKR